MSIIVANEYALSIEDLVRLVALEMDGPGEDEDEDDSPDDPDETW